MPTIIPLSDVKYSKGIYHELKETEAQIQYFKTKNKRECNSLIISELIKRKNFLTTKYLEIIERINSDRKSKN